jgi:cytidine deaminase
MKKVIIGENSELPSWNSPLSTHAEIDALNRLSIIHSKKFKKCKRLDYNLFVIRLTGTGKLASSRPCFHCLNTMNKTNVNIRYVYYSTTNGSINREKFRDMLKSSSTYVSNGHKHKTFN